MTATASARATVRARACWIVTLLLVVPWARGALAYDWPIEVVDNGKQFDDLTDRSLRVDADGHPHIAYGGDFLYYAWHDGSAWNYETVDESPRVGGQASLALDTAGRPHISYKDNLNDTVKYAHRDGSGWHAETAVSAGLPSRASLALDAQDRPHISYYDEEDDRTKYTYRSGSGWQTETVDSGVPALVDEYTSLVVDAEGFPHVGYHASGDVKYARRDSSGWHIELVDGLGWFGYTSLALDAEGLPHISYSYWDGGDLRYAHKEGSGWHIETVDGVCGSPSISLALDSGGKPHVSYRNAWGLLKHAYEDSSGWHIESIGAINNGLHTSLALDDQDSAHLVYLADEELKHAVRQSYGWWQVETVDTEGDAGEYTSLALDDQDLPHVSYYHSDRRDLTYACRNGSGWHIETADSGWGADPWMGSASLALDKIGRPHIAYHNATYSHYGLTYAKRDSLGWHIETADSGGGYITSRSLALDGGDLPHIGYFDGAKVCYARRQGSGWQTETVDSANFTGYSPSLAVDGEDLPHISYFDGNHSDLKYAHKDGSGWQIETVDTTGASIEGPERCFTSLVLDPDGLPHIAYSWLYNEGPPDWYDNYGHKYAHKDATGWHIETVDSVWWPSHTSLALDAESLPHIAYSSQRWPGGDLKYARKVGLGWYIETVETNGDLCAYTSLALDGDGMPHITYYDATSADLKYARATGELAGRGRPSSLAAGRLRLLRVSPNPATTEVVIRYDVGGGSETVIRRVSARIYDPLGRQIATLAGRVLPAGTHSVRWNLHSAQDGYVAPGVYYLRLQTDASELSDVARIVVIR